MQQLHLVLISVRMKTGKNRLAGLVVKGVSLESGRSRVLFPLATGLFRGPVIPVSDLKSGIQLATLPGAWSYRVSAGTGWPCVSIL